MANVVINWNTAHWHTDILWNQITWTITSSCKMSTEWHSISRNGDIVNFPSHPHSLDGYGNPTNYRTHSVAVMGTGKLQISWKHCVLDWDTVPVADEAGGNATMQATQFKTYSS